MDMIQNEETVHLNLQLDEEQQTQVKQEIQIQKDDQSEIKIYSWSQNINIVVVFVIMIVLIAGFFMISISMNGFLSFNLGSKGQTSNFPKILWIYTQRQLQAEKMLPSLIVNNWIYFTKQSSFQIRLINGFNSYDWLSENATLLVHKIKHSSKFGINIKQILKIVLLLQHGGLYVQINKAILVSQISDFQHIFRRLSDQKLNNDPIRFQQSQIILFYSRQFEERLYEDSIIYCKPNTTLLRQVFKIIKHFLVNGDWPYQHVYIKQKIFSTKATYINDLIFHSMNVLNKYNSINYTQFQRKFKILAINSYHNSALKNLPKKQLSNTFFQSSDVFYKENMNTVIINSDMKMLNQPIIRHLYPKGLVLPDSNILLAKVLINIDENRWLTKPISLKRQEVNLCVVSLKILPSQHQILLEESLKRLQSQDYKKWKAIYFAKNMIQVQTRFKGNDKIVIVNASLYSGLNFQRAAIKYCQPKSIAILLDYDQYFKQFSAFNKIAKNFENVGVYGLYTSLILQGNFIATKFGDKKIQRTVFKDNQQLIQDIANCFRIFSVSAYRLLSHTNLHHEIDDRYFNIELPLLNMLELFWNYNSCEQGQILYQLNKVSHKIQIPKIRMVDNDIIIISSQKKIINISSFQYFAKNMADQFCKVMIQYVAYKKRPIEEFLVLNNGFQFTGLKNRKNYPNIIPKKIHQVWVGGERSNFKKTIMQKNRLNHPSYEYFLWTQQNITLQNFPNSYYLIKSILEFSKTSTYNKLSTVGDLMKHEIIYHHGGFYMDTNYLIFGKEGLDNWRTFKAVIPSLIDPRQRVQRYSGIFGAIKGFKNFERIINHTILSTRDYYSHKANIEAGPFLISHISRGNEQYDEQIYQPSFQHNYPYMMPHKFKCIAPKDLPQQQILVKGINNYYKNCSNIYYYAFGIDFFSEGLSWMHPK